MPDFALSHRDLRAVQVGVGALGAREIQGDVGRNVDQRARAQVTRAIRLERLTIDEGLVGAPEVFDDPIRGPVVFGADDCMFL